MAKHKLLTKDIEKKLPALRSQDGKSPAQVRVVAKFFNPCGAGTWYATEACAILSDGREVSLAEADQIVRGVRNGNRKGAEVLPGGSREDNLRSAQEVPEPSHRQNQEQGLLGYPRGEESELERRSDAVQGVHVRSQAGTPPGGQERLREEGESRDGEDSRSSSPQGRDGPSQERGQVRRLSQQPGSDDQGPAPTPSRQPATQREEPPTIQDVIFFGYAKITDGELGYFSLDELASIKAPPFGLGIERDLYWDDKTTLQDVIDGKAT